MPLISLRASPVGSTLFEVSDVGAVSAVGLASTGAITGTSAVLSGALSSASLTTSGALSSASLTTSGVITQAVQTVAMAAANKTLIISGTPTSNQVLITANVLACTATGSTRTLTLPAAANMVGKMLLIVNTGSIQIDVTDGSITVSLTQGQASFFITDGTGYGSVKGA
jgi:hypothetical protein